VDVKSGSVHGGLAADQGPPIPPVEPDEEISQAKVTQILEEFESESPTRALSGFWRAAVGALAIALSVYALYWTQYSITTHVYRATFLMVVLVLSFMLYPIRTRRSGLEFLATLGVGGAMFVLFWTALNANAQQQFFGGPSLMWLVVGLLALAVVAAIYAWFDRGARMIVPWYDIVLAAVSVWSLVFLVQNYQAALQRIINPTVTEVLAGIIIIVLVLEATRRTTGWILPAVAVFFIIYGLWGDYFPDPFGHRGYPIQRIVGQNLLTLEGLFGVPLDVAATFIVLFSIYGAVLEYSGAGKFFIDWSFAALGRSNSAAGPGRTVTAAGFLLGTVSGSGVATTVTLGSLTWPMLKRGGYDRDTAGGIIAAAGIGALLSPPTLGAAAFLIAEYLNISYLSVLVMAIIPTLLYYLSCLLMIEADSRRMHTHAVAVEAPSLVDLTLKYGYHFSSLFAVAILMAIGLTPFLAVFWSIVIAFLLSFLRPETRLTSLGALAVGVVVGVAALLYGIARPELNLGWSQAAFWGVMAATGVAALIVVARALRRKFPRWAGTAEADSRILAAFEAGGRGTLSVAATTATAGVIVSIVTLTGLGLKISGIVVALSGGIPLLTVLYAALSVWILGLAVPVTASYIIAAVMIVPALRQIGVPEPAAHMFIFYYAVLADVSPPTALSPFAAAAITGGNPFRTTMLTWKYCLPAFLVPFMFTLSPEGATLLLLGDGGVLEGINVAALLWTLFTACIAVGALAVAFGGYMVTHASVVERVLMGVGGLALLYASQTSDLLGGALVIAATVLHVLRGRVALRGSPA
jgi:TRAP transporter 4TM/12TM fusion protein